MSRSKQTLENQVHNINVLLKLKPFATHSYILDKNLSGYQLQQFVCDNGTTQALTDRLACNEMYHFLLGMLTYITK